MADNNNRNLNVLKNKTKYSYRIGSTFSENSRRITAKQFEKDVYEGQLEFYAIVLSVENTEDFLGTSKTKSPITQARCFIPQIHASYPLPRGPQDYQIIDLFPLFQGPQKDYAKTIPGSLVRVKFADRNNVSKRVGNGKLIELMDKTQASAVGLDFSLEICVEKPSSSRVGINAKSKLQSTCNDLLANGRDPRKVGSQWAISSSISDCRSTQGVLGRDTGRPNYSEHRRFGLLNKSPIQSMECKTVSILSSITSGPGVGGGNCKDGYPTPIENQGGFFKFMQSVAASESSNNYNARRQAFYHDKTGKKVKLWCNESSTKPMGSQYWGKYQLGNAARKEAAREIQRIGTELTKNSEAGGPIGKTQPLVNSDYAFLFDTPFNGPQFGEEEIPKGEPGGTMSNKKIQCAPTNRVNNPTENGRWNVYRTYVLKEGNYKGKHLQDLWAAAWFNKLTLEVMNNAKVKQIINRQNNWNGVITKDSITTKVDLSSLVGVRHLLGMEGVLKYLTNPEDSTNKDQLGTDAKCYGMKFYGYDMWNLS